MSDQKTIKKYQVNFSVTIEERKSDIWGSGNQTPNIKFALTENIPEGRDPVVYLRERIKEEINRHSASAKFELGENQDI